MAEYYPLISRAVAGLRTAAPEARQAIYSRAQQALVGQLRAMQPAVPEEAIEREIKALDEAIARVETDITGPVAATAATKPPPPAPVIPRPLPPQPQSVSSPPAPAAPQLSAPRLSDVPRGEAPTLGGVQRSTPPRLRPAATRPVLPVLRPSASRLPAPSAEPDAESGRTVAKRADPDETSPRLADADEGATRPDAGLDAGPPPTAFPAAATLRIDRNEPMMRGGLPKADHDADEASGEPNERELPERARDDVVRPPAPRPVEERRPNLRVWIVAVAALAAVAAIAFTAWRLRDNPQELARIPVATKSVAPETGKIAERADATGPDAGQPDTTSSGPPVTNPTEAGATDAPPTTAAPDPNASAASTPSGQVVPIAYKAAILVDAPDEPQKVKTYVGTVVWRTETVSQGQDQPIGTAIRADIDIPDAKLQMVMEFRRNTEAQFPASHTMDLKFTVAADSPLAGAGQANGSAGIKQVNVPQMRRDDMPTGDPLAGVPVTITDNYFLIGLTRGDPESRNLDLIQSRGWFDIPMLLASGKASKITFEKGASGSKIFDDVMQGWKTQN